MDGRQHTMVTGSTASIHGVCLFFCLVRHQNLGKTFSNMVLCKKMHAWLISETSNLDFRKGEKGGLCSFFAKNQFYHSKANKVFVDVWSKRDT